MPEKGDRFRKIVDRLIRRFSQEPLSEDSMYDHESRATKFANDMNTDLERLFPRSPTHEYTPIQWTTRTSMKDIQNAAALDAVIEEIGQEAREVVANRLGISLSDLENHFKAQGDQLDRMSVLAAYTIVECNLDHQYLPDPSESARKFLEILNNNVGKHNPDYEEVHVDALTPLSQGQKPLKGGALFEATYLFVSTNRKIDQK